MPESEVDLRGLEPGTAPPRDALTGSIRDAEHVVVRGGVPALAAVLAHLWRSDQLPAVSVSWDPADDDASVGLARDLGIGTGSERQLPLVRDDHGGVLLHHGRIEAVAADAADGRRRLGGLVRPRRFGAQAHHDDARVADGDISRIEARPDWSRVDTLGVSVVTVPLRPARHTLGRALQVACDPAQVTRDGVPMPRPVSRWTWYADDRVRWVLRP